MQTLLEILRKSEDFLKSHGVAEARLDAEHIIAHRLGCNRMQIYLQFDRPMTEDILKELRQDILRRSRREPLAYILGNAHFMDFELHVGPGVLIPRPETEELVEKSISLLTETPARMIDLCTGSGAIALALKEKFSQAEVSGVDISDDALKYARENGIKYGMEITWICRDWRSSMNGLYDLIISNPPYLKESEWAEAEPEVKSFEPKIALTAGMEGDSEIVDLISLCYTSLRDGGLLALETGISSADKWVTLAKEAGYQKSSVIHDLSGRERFFFAWK